MKKFVFMLIIILPLFSFAQKRGSVWCFGDSALVDFSDTSNILIGSSCVKTRGSCVSICDTSGKLLFYANTRPGIAGNTTLVWDSIHNLMQNGDSIVGEGWYHELLIVPFPNSDSLYYLFSIGVTGSSQNGLYYSIVDLNSNGNLGTVIQKNIQLKSFKMADCLTAIKHGNGSDWWVLCRKSNISNGGSNKWYEYLITTSGISNVIVQNKGSINTTNLGCITFNHNGSKMIFNNYKGLMEIYDFNRCTGVISNPNTIYSESLQNPWTQLWSTEFSPSNNLLYVTHIAASAPDTCLLVQFDLNSANIASSADTLWTTSFMKDMGQLKLAPDGKIYLSNSYYGGYPYSDTTYNMYNMNLSVINSPDSLGAACNLQPYSFYLGGKRTYFGLPNNPDYDMPALAGSPCDTITGIESPPAPIGGAIQLTYLSEWQKLFINAHNLKGKNCVLKIYDVNGREVFSSTKKTQPPYFTLDVECRSFAVGVYLVSLITEKEKLSAKFVKE